MIAEQSSTVQAKAATSPGPAASAGPFIPVAIPVSVADYHAPLLSTVRSNSGGASCPSCK